MDKSQEEKDKTMEKWSSLFNNPNRKKVKKIIKDKKKKKEEISKEYGL